jgi:hypothetical protein
MTVVNLSSGQYNTAQPRAYGALASDLLTAKHAHALQIS